MWHVVIMAYVAGAEHGMWRSCAWAFWMSAGNFHFQQGDCSFLPSLCSWQVHLVPTNQLQRKTKSQETICLTTMQPAISLVNFGWKLYPKPSKNAMLLLKSLTGRFTNICDAIEGCFYHFKDNRISNLIQ